MSTKVLTKIGPIFAVPMRVLTAAKDPDDDEKDLHTVCEGTPLAPHPTVQVRQRYKCPYVGKDAKGKDVPCGNEHSSYHPFPRGRENPDKTWTVLSAEELASVGVANDVKDTLTLMRCRKGQVDETAIPNGKFYYLGVGDGAGKEYYGVVRDMILDEIDEWTYLTVWAYRTAPSLVKVVIVGGNVLAIQQIAWPAQVQQLPNVELPAYDERWLPLVKQAAELITVEFDPASFTDVRKDKIAEMLAAAPTVEGVAPSTPVASTSDAGIADLVAWIEKSKKTVGAKSKTAKKTAAKKTAAPRKTVAVRESA